LISSLFSHPRLWFFDLFSALNSVGFVLPSLVDPPCGSVPLYASHSFLVGSVFGADEAFFFSSLFLDVIFFNF